MADLLWAGIGARKTPPLIQADMTTLARSMAAAGWHLSSGGADGADAAFAAGTPPGQRTVWLPWPTYNGLSGPDCHLLTPDRMQESMAIAERHHPAWHRCSSGAGNLHARNVPILLGPDLDRPVDAVVCWTEGGRVEGGTGMGLRIAAEHNIPVLNLGSITMPATWDRLQALQRSLAANEPMEPRETRLAAPQAGTSRTYDTAEACVFRFTRADWGIFSNFCPLPEPIPAAGREWPTSEHLYQAAKYRLSPDVQQQIASAPTPRDAAALGRNRQNTPDADWNSRRVDAMRWVLRMKREANPGQIDAILGQTGDRPIVEYSGHDAFWGARPIGNTLVGQNVLGRLWMELRQHIRDGDPRALASAWQNPLSPGTVPTTLAAAQDQMARVVHIRNAPPDAIRIDRRTRWGNPFVIGPDGSREEVIEKYRADLWNQIHAGKIDLNDLASLHSRVLSCHCAPMPCHGDVLAEAAAWAVANKELTPTMRLPATSPLVTSAAKISPALHALFMDPKAFASPEHADISATYRRLYEDATRRLLENPGDEHELLPYSDHDLAELIYMVDEHQRELGEYEHEPAMAAETEYAASLTDLRNALKGTLTRYEQVKDLQIEIRQLLETHRDLQTDAHRDGIPVTEHPDYENWLHARSTTLAFVDRCAATPEMAPHIDRVLTNLDELRNAVSSRTANATEQTGRSLPVRSQTNLDERLNADIERSRTITTVQNDIADLFHQLSHIEQTAAGAIEDSPLYPALAEDCTRCLERWNALQADPDMQPHLEHLALPVIETRVHAISLHAKSPEPAESRTQPRHPIVETYTRLLEQADGKAELIAYQDDFNRFLYSVNYTVALGTDSPQMLDTLKRLSEQLEQSAANSASVADISQALTQRSSEAHELENWAQDHPGQPIHQAPAYAEWRQRTNATLDTLKTMERRPELAPHLEDVPATAESIQRRTAYLTQERFQRPQAPDTAQQQALEAQRQREASQPQSRGMSA